VASIVPFLYNGRHVDQVLLTKRTLMTAAVEIHAEYRIG
jgi:hypothetical protein